MSSFRSMSFLRRVLLLDAVSAGGMGLGLLVFGDALAPLVQMPAELLWHAAVVLLPFAAFVAFLSTRAVPSGALVWAVIVINAIWVVDSIVLLVPGSVAPNTLGYAFVVGQAAVVAVLASLQYVGLCKLTTAVPNCAHVVPELGTNSGAHRS